MIDQKKNRMLAPCAPNTSDGKSYGIVPGSSLTYRPLHGSPGIELSDWKGIHGGPALSTHFHHEAQLTVVLAGDRWFLIGSRKLRVPAGQFVMIPPGVPHQAIGHQGASTRSYDVFFNHSTSLEWHPTRLLTGSVMIDHPMLPRDVVATVIEQTRRERFELLPTILSPSPSAEMIVAVLEDHQKISDIAAFAGMSREGFIRKFRDSVGMTPHAYRIADRVCRARKNLRSAMPPAEAAYDAGFADQSHMGRAFRKLYGTTPAVFRKAWLHEPSQSFQIENSTSAILAPEFR